MSGSVNKAILVGSLGADPEVRRLNNGNAVVNLRLATTETWRDKSSGGRKESTQWHNVVIFNEGLVKVAEQYLKKGSKIYVEGQIQNRSWEDQSGQKKYTTEIVLQAFGGQLVMLGDPKGGDDRQQRGTGVDHRSNASGYGGASGGRIPPMDDDGDAIPFAPEVR